MALDTYHVPKAMFEYVGTVLQQCEILGRP